METALRTKRGGGVPARNRDFYLDAGREYVRRFGADAMVAASFNPAAAKRGGRPDLVDRYYDGREDGSPWPSLNAIKMAFSGFTNFRAALDLPPNPTGGRGRRAPGQAEPILNVRERRIIVAQPTAEQTEQTAFLRKQLAAAERRALRAEERLEAAKVEVAETPVNHERLVKALRDRLADEKSRRKDVQRELHNAVRREDRARTRTQIVSRRDPALLREVDRLTDRLAEAQETIRKLEAATPDTKVVVQPVVRTRTVTKTVTEKDEKSLRRAERAERRLEELREELGAVRSVRDDLAARVETIRREAVAEAVADRRVRTAERQVAELEKKMAEQAELLVGERRWLTDEEVERLRVKGPAGYVVFAQAVKKVARARAEGSRAETKAALMVAVSAALNWMDRL